MAGTDPYEVRDKMNRWRATASTWADKATHYIYHFAKNSESPQMRWLAGYEAGRLLRELLNAAELLAPLLNEDQDYEIEDARQKAQDIAKILRNRTLATKLSNTTGRTPEEAEAFERKAQKLRDSS